MRKLNGFAVNPANEKLSVEVHDEPGAGGANHLYAIYGFHTAGNKSASQEMQDDTSLKILFQNGPIPEVGVNGITQEVLAVIIVDRLRSFQAGPFACRENALALTKFEEGLHWLQHRTRERISREVEGTHAV